MDSLDVHMISLINFVDQVIKAFTEIRNKLSINTEELGIRLDEINDLCSHGNVIKEIIENNYHEDLHNLLKHEDLQIIRKTLNLLSIIIKSDFEITNDFISSVCDSVCEILTHRRDIIVVESCLKFLADIFKDTFGDILSNNTKNTFKKIITESIIWDNSNIVFYSLHLLSIEDNNEDNKNTLTNFLIDNIDQLIIKIRVEGTSEKLAILICELFMKSWSNFEKNSLVTKFLDKNFDDILVKILFHSQLTISANYYLIALKILCKLLYFGFDKMKSIFNCSHKNHAINIIKHQSDIVLFLLESLRRFSVKTIYVYGLKLFYLILCVSKTLTRVLNETDQELWVHFILELMGNHAESTKINYWSYKIICKLCILNPKLILNSTVVNDSSVDTLLQKLYSPKLLTPKLIITTCDLISVLSFYSEKIQNRFLDSQVYKIIHLNMKKCIQMGIPDTRVLCQIQIATANTFRALVIYNLSAKEYFYNEDTQYKEAEKLVMCKKFHKHLVKGDEEVVAANLLFLASLAAFNSIKYELMQGKKFDLRFIMRCEVCSKSVSVMEAAQEMLIVFSGIGSEIEFLVDIFSIENWCELAKTFSDDYNIQKNTIIFLQLNSSKIDRKNQTHILSSIAEMIYRAIIKFDKSLIIKAESCVLIQILIKQYPDFCKVCVSKNLEIFLFDSINQTFSEELKIIALQAFYMLTELKEILPSILLKATSNQNIMLLQLILAIGTNLNKDERNNILLSAVKQKNETLSYIMTSFLINDRFKPNKFIINECFQSNNYSVVTLLLKYFNIHESDKGFIVNWSELGMKKFDIFWLDKLSQDLNVEMDKNILWLNRMIKLELKNRQTLRTNYEINQKYLTQLFRYPFTQKRIIEKNYGGYQYMTRKSFIDKLNSSEDSKLTKGFSVRETKKTSRDLQRNTLIRNEDFNTVFADNIGTESSCEKRLTYSPMSKEVVEFLSDFRCGSDYSYHSLDPRCLFNAKESQNVDITDSHITYLFRESYDENSIKVTPGKHQEDKSYHLQMETLYKSLSENTSQATIDSLNLSKNRLVDIDCFMEISKHNNLSLIYCNINSLNLENNKISIINGEVFHIMIVLQDLDLSFNCLKTFPWEIFKHCPLVKFKINNNELTSFIISQDIRENLKVGGKIENLKLLDLSENKIRDFDVKSLSIFFNLEKLSINHIANNNFKDELLPLNNLKVLDMKGNNPLLINENFLKFSASITSINMSKNSLDSVRNTTLIDFAAFENLVVLDLSYNNLACDKPYFIPMRILKIPNLQIIDMSHNKIVEFPSCVMWASTSLTEINFSNNLIQNLDLFNAKLKFQNVQILDVSHNNLRKIPSEIGDLVHLYSLNISYNPNLKRLPDEIGSMKYLTSLIREGVKINLPTHFTENTQLKEIKKYYYNRLTNAVEYRNLKLTVLGLKGRGKTSLLTSLQGLNPNIANSSPNVKINVSTWKLQNNLVEKHFNYHFTCWDITGLEEFAFNHECFLSQRALYILIFDVTKEIEEIRMLKPWLCDLKSLAPYAPLIIVGTHVDKLKNGEKDSICSFMKAKLFILGQTVGINQLPDPVYVDSRNNNNTIRALKKRILEVLTNHRVRMDYTIIEKQPISYIKLEEIFQESLKILSPAYPILTEKEIKDLVHKNKLELDDDEIKQAIQFLHNSGVLIHLDDMFESSDNICILKPQWLCHLISKTSTMKRVNPFINNGIMKLSDFRELFKNRIKDLPSHITREIYCEQCLKIFEKYDVLFRQLPDEIIIPSKLSNNPIKTVKWDDTIPKICRIYEFNYLPTGFWSRLITRLSVLVKSFSKIFETCKIDLSFWKTGMIIIMENTVCLLEGKHTEIEIINISVTESELGIKILVKVVDCIDVLIEEWYPGLILEDVKGRSIMMSYCVCPKCKSKIPLSDIANSSTKFDYYICKGCKALTGTEMNILIRNIAPDIFLGDLPEDLIIKPNLLELEITNGSSIGSGGNGKVYKGHYMNEDCAVKCINSFDHSCCPPSYRLLRQEIEILRQCRHPSIIGLLAVDREKIVLEYAPLFDLRNVLSKYILSKALLQRIAYQVIAGIKFLHQKFILYRDIKMQNVLVFSLELSANINIKLADYGISREVAPFSFIHPQGTYGYQAPEVLEKKFSYNLPADIYSFGILLFNLATRGHHPSDFKAHWKAGKKNEIISIEKFENWPRMQDCITHCTEENSKNRPNANDIIKFISCPSFVSMRSKWPITNETRISCMVTAIKENTQYEVFLVNGNYFKQEVRCFDLTSGKAKGRPFGKEGKTNKILCMTAFESDIILGTQSGQLFVYEGSENNFREDCSKLFTDSVTSIILISFDNDRKVLIVGLANGIIHYKIDYDIKSDLESIVFNEIILFKAPILNINFLNDQIFVTCGSVIYKLLRTEDEQNFAISTIVELPSKKEDRLIKCFFPFSENINNISNTIFYFTLKDESSIYNYDDQGTELKPPILCKEIILKKVKITESNILITIMCFAFWSGDRYLAAGMSTGHLLIIDQVLNYSQVLTLFLSPIICIQHSKIPINCGRNEDSKNYISVSKISSPLSMSENVTNNITFSTGLIIVGNGYKSIDKGAFKGATMILIADDITTIGKEMDEHITSRNKLY